MKNKICTDVNTQLSFSSTDPNFQSPAKFNNDVDTFRNYLDTDFKLDEEIFDFYLENPKNVNRKIKSLILNLFSI
jgi:hypothetical protein